MGRLNRLCISRAYPTEDLRSESAQRLCHFDAPAAFHIRRVTRCRWTRKQQRIRMHHVEFSSPATLLALLLLLLSETGACTPPAVHDVGPFPSMSKFRARLAPAFAWNAPSRLLKNQRDIAGPFSTSKPQPSRPRSIFARGVQAMDVNGSDITDVEKKAALDSRQEGLWKREAGPAIDRPRIETPLDLPQVGYCIRCLEDVGRSLQNLYVSLDA